MVNRDLRDYEKALIDFEKAIHLDPNYAEAYHNRGFVNAQLEQYKEAIADFDEAIRLNPDYMEAYNYRGLTKTMLEQYEEAIADFDETIRLNPNHAKAYDNRGMVKNGLKQYESAISDHTAAISIMPDFAEAYAHRGDAKAELGNIDEAKSDLQTALALLEQQGNPDFKTLVETWLQRLDQMDSKQKNDKQSRRGGQWKRKAKIAEDFDELPESLNAEAQQFHNPRAKVPMKPNTDIGTTTVDECTKDKRMDKAFEQILEIAFDAGLLVFMTDEDNAYTQRVLIERPVEDENEDSP